MRIINGNDELFAFLKGNHFGEVAVFSGVRDGDIIGEIQYPFDSPLFPEKELDKIHVKFTNCDFRDAISLRSTESLLFFENCRFHGNIRGNSSVFSGKMRFRDCHFYTEVNFKNSVFDDLADFYRCHFYKRTIFHKTDFMQTAVFSGVVFHENVLFTYTLINKLIIFRGTKFLQGIDLSLSILSGSFSVFDIELKDYDALTETLSNDEYEENVSKLGEIPIKNKRETFRVLRKTFEVNSDYIHSLDYKKLELHTYDKILDHNIKLGQGVYSSIFNKIILFLNRKSNLYGTRFEYGVLFTFLVGLFFFYFSYINLNTIEFAAVPCQWSFGQFEEFSINFLKFLNPVHSVDYLGEQHSLLFYFFDYLGRIFVGYGIYQTVQAFRKYK